MTLVTEMLPYLLAFGSGLLVKTVDWLDDERKSKNPIKYFLALCYGTLIGYIMGTTSFSLLFLAALVAQVFARKIDTPAHLLGFVASALSVFFFGFPSIEPVLFAYFLILAFLDEVDYIGQLRPLTIYRPFLKIGTIIFLFVGRVDYFIAILAFDAGYEIFAFVKKHIK